MSFVNKILIAFGIGALVGLVDYFLPFDVPFWAMLLAGGILGAVLQIAANNAKANHER